MALRGGAQLLARRRGTSSSERDRRRAGSLVPPVVLGAILGTVALGQAPSITPPRPVVDAETEDVELIFPPDGPSHTYAPIVTSGGPAVTATNEAMPSATMFDSFGPLLRR